MAVPTSFKFHLFIFLFFFLWGGGVKMEQLINHLKFGYDMYLKLKCLEEK